MRYKIYIQTYNLVTQLTTSSDLAFRKITFLAVQLFCCYEVACEIQEMKKKGTINSNQFSLSEVLPKTLVSRTPESHDVYLFKIPHTYTFIQIHKKTYKFEKGVPRLAKC